MSDLLDYLQAHEPAFKSPNRLASLYSDFDQRRQTNPEGYAANSSAWLSALNTLSQAGQLPLSRTGSGQSHLAFSSGQPLLKSLSSSRYGQPQALGAVFADAIKAGTLMPMNQFLASEKRIYQKSWIPTPTDVVSWGLRAIGFGSSGAGNKLITGDLVVVAAVEQVAETIAKQLSAQSSMNLTDRIYSRALFEDHFRTAISAEQPLSSADFDILLRYLSRDKPILATSAMTIKVLPTPGVPEPITAEDASIANLRTLISSMTEQLSALETRITALHAEARTLATTHPTRAKTLLRQKRAAETTLTQRTETLTTLEKAWDSISQAATNVAITAAMRDSATVLKSLNARVGGAEGADEVMQQLQSEMDATAEINDIVTEGARAGVDEDAVDAELEDILRADREREERQTALRERAERERLEKQKADAQREQEREAERQAEETRLRLEGLHVPHGELRTAMEE